MKPLWHANLWRLFIPAKPLAGTQFPLNLFLWKKIGMDTKFPSWTLAPKGEGLKEAERSLTHPHFTDEESEAYIGRGPAIIIIIKQEGSSLGKPGKARGGGQGSGTLFLPPKGLHCQGMKSVPCRCRRCCFLRRHSIHSALCFHSNKWKGGRDPGLVF